LEDPEVGEVLFQVRATKAHLDLSTQASPKVEKRSCPGECKYPNCVIGSQANGGADLGGKGACEHFCSSDIGGTRYCGHGDEYKTGNFVDCTACSTVEGTWSFSLHDIVGEDGALVLSLVGDQRFDRTYNALNQVNVKPIRFPATNAEQSSWEELESGCRSQNEGSKATCEADGKAGEGCGGKVEQAIAASHKRALEAAMQRNHEWTAIFEDDATPLAMYSDTWGEGLRKAWATLPPDAKIVRLGWCESKPDWVKVTQVASHAPEEPFLAYHVPPGGCTHAYLVHRDIIPELLGTFPCCCALDCCWEIDYFDRPDASGRMRAESILLNMDIDGSSNSHWELFGPVGFGIAAQNRQDMASTRPTLLSGVGMMSALQNATSGRNHRHTKKQSLNAVDTAGPGTTVTTTMGAQNCDVCVREFAAAGGCACMADNGCDARQLIPTGCDGCGDQATTYCATHK
jgi:hypothetical protein